MFLNSEVGAHFILRRLDAGRAHLVKCRGSWSRSWTTVAVNIIERRAQPGYAPDPDLSKLPAFSELVRMALGGHGMLCGEAHPIYRDLFGILGEDAADDL